MGGHQFYAQRTDSGAAVQRVAHEGKVRLHNYQKQNHEQNQCHRAAPKTAPQSDQNAVRRLGSGFRVGNSGEHDAENKQHQNAADVNHQLRYGQKIRPRQHE